MTNLRFLLEPSAYVLPAALFDDASDVTRKAGAQDKIFWLVTGWVSGRFHHKPKAAKTRGVRDLHRLQNRMIVVIAEIENRIQL